MLERRMAGSKPGTSNVARDDGAGESVDALGTTEPSRAS
jgi:hypothetical protein